MWTVCKKLNKMDMTIRVPLRFEFQVSYLSENITSLPFFLPKSLNLCNFKNTDLFIRSTKNFGQELFKE
jgi:hypothetical protein